MRTSIGHPCSGHAGRHPDRNSKIVLPSPATELAAFDLNRPLPAEILRLFVGQNFLRIDFGVDGF
jgi:hypothetical protein